MRFFAAQPGDYVVTYSDYTAPVSPVTTTRSPSQVKSAGKSNTTEAVGATTSETETAALPSDNQSPLNIKSLTPTSTPGGSTATKPEASSLATVATVMGAAVVVVGCGAGIWVAIKRYRLK